MSRLKAHNYPLNNLLLARRNAEFTQQEAADELGISIGAIQNHESGKSQPTIDMLRRYAGLYGIDDYRMLLPSEAELKSRNVHK